MMLKKFPWRKVFLFLVLAGILSYGALFALVQAGNRDSIVGEPQVMIVLGCQVMPTGEPSILLQDRLDEAYDHWAENSHMTIVVSGGQGPDEPTTEAQAMADYLAGRGVPAEQILLEDQSHNTHQNLRYSLQVMEEAGMDVPQDTVIVSSGFHLTRAKMLWERATEGAGQLSTLAAPSSHLASSIYMNVREPLALVKSFLFDR